MSEQKERDYILGTNQAELDRLGLQHRVWQPHVLKCWYEAGIKDGSRVLDIGAGPGYATFDLAEIVGQTGSIVAVERSQNYLNRIHTINEQKKLNIKIYELDLMDDEIPEDEFDFSWTRWVCCFVSSPEILVDKIHRALKPNGKAIFHEYINYDSWRLIPASIPQKEFVSNVMNSWRETGGEPDIAGRIVELLNDRGFTIKSKPLIFAPSPKDYMWEWPASFVEVNLDRLIELGKADETWAETVRKDFREARSNPNATILTPMVLEIVAEKK